MSGVGGMFDLTGKVALITGGSRGLGLQMAEALVDAGARVILTARKADELAEAKARLEARGGTVAVVVCDLSKFDTIPAVVDEVIAAFGDIDILVNNAGTTWGAPMEEHPFSGWQKVMDLNVTAPFVLTQEVGRRCFLPRRAGKVLNIASIAGMGGNRPDIGMFTIAYNTSKAAMINFTRTLAAEWGRYGVNVNALAPGFFPSKMADALIGQIEGRLMPAIPLGRFGGPDDLKGPALLLVSEAGRHITGQCLAVDGGMMA